MRERRLPQHRRVLEPPYGHVHDSGQLLHPAMRILRRAEGRAAGGGLRRTAPSGRGRARLWVCDTPSSPASTGTTARTAGAELLRLDDPCHPGAHSRTAKSRSWSPTSRGRGKRWRSCSMAAPDVLNHNIETVPRLYRQVRIGARYERSLEIARERKSLDPAIPDQERTDGRAGGDQGRGARHALRDLRATTWEHRHHRPVPAADPDAPAGAALRAPAEFAEYRAAGMALGFSHVESGPLVRSQLSRRGSGLKGEHLAAR